MKRIAVFPGSFDPITTGHMNIIGRALPLFDELIIAIGNNSEKKYFFPMEKRKAWLESLFTKEKKIKVAGYSGLTVKFCGSIKAAYIVRGIRTAADFEFERSIAQMNKAMAPDIETVFILAEPAYSAVASTIVRDIIRNGGDASAFVPPGINLQKA